jgi:hypothetical protein
VFYESGEGHHWDEFRLSLSNFRLQTAELTTVREADFILRLRYAAAMCLKRFCLALAIALLATTVLAQQSSAAKVETPAKDSLVVTTPTHAQTTLSAADLKAMAHITITFHNTHTNADETYSGVRLADILTKFGAPLGSDLRGKALANYVIATGSDGYLVVLALAEIDPSFHPGEVIVADATDGKPLDAHSGPLKLVVTEDKRPARSVRNLVSIELKSAQ